MPSPPPSSGPDVVLAALEAKDDATPAEIADWFRDTYGPDLPVTEGTLRQTVTRLARQGRIHPVDRPGAYANGPGKKSWEEMLAEETARRTEPEAQAVAPFLSVTALYDETGRHFADRVVAIVQHFTPYAAEVSREGVERAIAAPVLPVT